MSYFHDGSDSDCAPQPRQWRSKINKEYTIGEHKAFVYGNHKILGVKYAELELISWFTSFDEWYCESGKLTLLNYDEAIIEEFDLESMEGDTDLIKAINLFLSMDVKHEATEECDFSGSYV